MGPEARLAQHVALQRWHEFDVIHLACHGRFVPASPLDTTLYLGSEALRATGFEMELPPDVDPTLLARLGAAACAVQF